MKITPLRRTLLPYKNFILSLFILSNMFIGGNALVSGQASGDFSTGLSNLIADVASFILPEPEPVVYLPESITLTMPSTSIYLGTSNRITATFTPSNTTDKSIVWSSSDTSIVEVTSGGIAVARNFGTATITAQSSIESVKASIELTVIDFPDVTDFSMAAYVFEDEVNAIDVGTTARLILADLVPANGKINDVLITSSDETIATINDDRIITGLSEGNVEITATIGSLSKAIELRITSPLEPAIIPDTFSISGPTTGYVSRAIQLMVDFGNTTPTDTQLTFKSSSTTVARVTNMGVVTGVNFSGLTSRNVTITAYPNANPNLVSTWELTIEKVFPTSVSLSASPNVTAGNSLSITPTFTPADTTDRQLVWTSSNAELATVSSAGDTGLVVGKFSGSVTITATSVMDDSIVATITIEILPAPLFSPAQWAEFLMFVRKGIGHVTLNFINGVLGFLTFYVFVDPRTYRHVLLSLAVGIPLSIFHELLQFLAPGRTPTVMDAFYNSFGYALAQGFMLVFVAWTIWLAQRKAYRKLHPKPSWWDDRWIAIK